MRPVLAFAPVVLVLALTACATTTTESYNDDLRRLSDDCKARGGILTPTGVQAGRPEADNFCTITGGASRLPPRP